MERTDRYPQVNTERLVEEFKELVAIDSVSFHERRMADTLKSKLLKLGFEVYEDGAAEVYGSEAGNVYGFLPGTLEGPPLLLSAHMDTVEPGWGKRAVIHPDGRITSEGDTVLGSDDAAGIASILEAVRAVSESGQPHRGIGVLFPMAEEAYGKGSTVAEYERLRAKEAYTLDLSGPVGQASLQEPTFVSFSIEFVGKASHAGFAPEEGINAIAAAAAAITRIRQGRVGEETTVNIGKIEGGKATNIVPALVRMEGEIRSYVHEAALAQMEQIRRICEDTAVGFGAVVRVDSRLHMLAYRVEEKEPVVQRFRRVCETLGVECSLTRTLGGSDNNCFIRHGIRGVVLSCGMNQVHSTEEFSSVSELERCASIVVGLIVED